MIEQIYHYYTHSTGICTDTRHLQVGNLFVALRGEHFDGNQYAQQALQKGASCVLIDRPECQTDNDNCILVDDTLQCLQDLASYHRRQSHVSLIALTGSNGKTTTKELLHAVLSSTFRTHATSGNLNNHIGVPLTLLAAPHSAQIWVIEMGANHQQEIAMLCRIAQPTHALITNIGKAHLEGFGGQEGVQKGKGELFDYIRQTSGYAFVNRNDGRVAKVAEGIAPQNFSNYGNCPSDDVFVVVNEDNNSPFLQAKWRVSAQEFAIIHTQLTGNYNIDNITAAIAVGLHFGVTSGDIIRAIKNYIPKNNRSQRAILGSNTLIMDAYNANPSSMKAALDNFARDNSPQKAVILGEMLELGNEAEIEHQAIVQLLQKSKPEHIVLVGKGFENAAQGIDCQYFEKASQAKKWLAEQTWENMSILVKGSRGVQLEVVYEVWKTV